MNQTQLWKTYPAVRLLIIQLLGYEVSHHLLLSQAWVAGSLALVFILMLAHHVMAKSNFGIRSVALLMGLFIGFSIYANYRNHCNHQQFVGYQSGDSLRLEILEVLSDGRVWTNYRTRVVDLWDTTGRYRTACGEMLVHAHESGLRPGQRIRIWSPINPIRTKLYDGFNGYKRYLHAQGMYVESWVRKEIYVEPYKRTLRGVAFQIRTNIDSCIQTMACRPQSIALLKSLIIGNRSELSDETTTQFRKSGTLHVLALSGLHVGILYSILNQVLRMLQFILNARVRTLLVITGLWGFAVITGLSASICRSALMFSLFACAQLLNRSNTPLNSWAVAALLLLLAHPDWYRTIGFQFSFLAVGGILLWFKPLQRRLSCSHPFLVFLRDISLLSVCAQAAVLPLSVYYFHQIPLYFLFSNIVIVPAVSVLLIAGIVGLTITTAGFTIDLITLILDAYSFWLEKVTTFFASLPGAVVYAEWTSDQSMLVMLFLILGMSRWCYPKNVYQNQLIATGIWVMKTCI
ncbi:MAG: ComEC/Rec2 family competence protein [Bacteroidetes bacterium]|nr:ComEC/Rec2 family competence protein [Bacteroidota bacterium]